MALTMQRSSQCHSLATMTTFHMLALTIMTTFHMLALTIMPTFHMLALTISLKSELNQL